VESSGSAWAFTEFLRAGDKTQPRFYAPMATLTSFILTWELFMDAVFITLAIAVWGAMVLLVKGFQHLETPKGGRA
jgi:hypothetical protein